MIVRTLFALTSLAMLCGSAAAAKEPAEDTDAFCPTLKRILAAASDPTPFQSVDSSIQFPWDGVRNAAPPRLPGFTECGATYYDVGGAYVFRCQRLFRANPPPPLSAAMLTAETERCLGLSAKQDAKGPRFNLPNAVISIGDVCSSSCEVGRYVSYSIRSKITETNRVQPEER